MRACYRSRTTRLQLLVLATLKSQTDEAQKTIVNAAGTEFRGNGESYSEVAVPPACIHKKIIKVVSSWIVRSEWFDRINFWDESKQRAYTVNNSNVDQLMNTSNVENK